MNNTPRRDPLEVAIDFSSRLAACQKAAREGRAQGALMQVMKVLNYQPPQYSPRVEALLNSALSKEVSRGR